jgi:CheY-like chemotaxis protein
MKAMRCIPIVVLTSSNQPNDLVACYGLGANGFVTKPMEFADLEQKIALVAGYWLHVNQVP